MKKLCLVFISLIILSTNLTFSQESKELLGFYDSELFQFNFDMLGGLQITYRGQTSTAKFGIPKSFIQNLDQYPDSKNYIEAYRKLNKTANVFFWTGLGALVVVFPFSISLMNESVVEVGSSVAFGGMVSIIVGAFLYPASYNKLLLSVNTYNRKKLQEF